MTKITESAIELLAIQHIEMLGYHYLYGPDIAADGHSPERGSFEQVLLINRLKTAIRKINPVIPYDAQNEAIKEIQRIATPELISKQ